MNERRAKTYEAAGTLLHESMHYIYSLYDEYGNVELNPLEDRAELTGFLSLDESVIPLSDWYFQRGFAFERNRRYLFKLHNLGGRPYRINAWVDGQVLDVASNTPKTTLPWVVRFY